MEIRVRARTGFAIAVGDRCSSRATRHETQSLEIVRRIGVEMPKLSSLPAIGKPIYAAAESATTKHVIVDVPPMGFVWVRPGGTTSGTTALFS